MVLWRKHTPRSLKCQRVALDLCLGPYSGLSDLSMTEKALAQYPTPETSSSGPSWGKKEQTMSMDTPLVPEIVVSITLGSLPLRAISSHMSKLLTMVAYNQPYLANTFALVFALIVVALYWMSSRSRSPLLLPRARRRIILLHLLTSTRILDASGIINFSLYRHSCADHRVHIL